MTAFVDDTAHDALLTTVSAATEYYLCSGDPADRAAAIAASLTTNPLTPPAATGPQNAAGGGREIEYAGISNQNIDNAGTWTVVVLCDATKMLLKQDLQAAVGPLNPGDTVSHAAWKHSVADPA